jgi:hypothetical protein
MYFDLVPGLLDKNGTLQEFAFEKRTYESEHNIIRPFATCNEVEYGIMILINRGIKEQYILSSISNLN